jgi:membrane protein
VKLFSLPGAVTDFGEQSLRRFVQVEGAQQATVLAAQAFTSLIPFLVVSAAFGPGEGDIADRINDRFDLHGSAARSVEALFNDSGEVTSAVTWVSIIILVLSATSFTRALQRMFQRAYQTEPGGSPAILLGAREWRRLLPGALVSAMLGALLGAASNIYVPILLTWSADRYGLIGVAFSLQSWLLAAAFIVVIGAVVGAVASERLGDRLDRIARASPTGIA